MLNNAAGCFTHVIEVQPPSSVATISHGQPTTGDPGGSLELHHVALHVPGSGARRAAVSWGSALLRDPLEVRLGHAAESGGESYLVVGQLMNQSWG